MIPTKLAPCSSDFVHVHQTAMKPTSEVQRRGKGPRRSQRKGSCNQLHLFLLGILGYPERGIPLETWKKPLEISVLIQHFWSPTNQPPDVFWASLLHDKVRLVKDMHPQATQDVPWFQRENIWKYHSANRSEKSSWPTTAAMGETSCNPRFSTFFFFQVGELHYWGWS